MTAVMPDSEHCKDQYRLNSPVTQPLSRKSIVVQHQSPKNVEHYKETQSGFVRMGNPKCKKRL